MSLETFEAGYAGARPPRKGTQWSGVWRLQQQVDRIIDTAWPQPWGLAGARSDFPIFSIADQETTSTDVFFKSDGTKFYIVGSTNDTVYQYSCSTAWDINTASYDSKSFSVTTQDTNPTGLFFKSDGTTFYIIGSGSDTVYQYSCSTAWDISTASYDSKSFSVNAQESGPTGLFFKDDGTKFYIIGSGSDTIYQYSCSTAWDISTASYDSKSFSFGTQETSPTGLFFKDDGTKFYIVGITNDTIYQYSCSTAWDISTASYDSKSFSVNTQENAPAGLFFKPDGAKFYIVGTAFDTIYQYSLLLE
jgi:sugar lactone lactonase YvrE